MENEYFTLTLESMAADPAYLIYEYDLMMTDKGMEKLGGEVPQDEQGNYRVFLEGEISINDKKDNISQKRTVEKISDRKFKIVEIYYIANINENNLNVKKELEYLCMYKTEKNHMGDDCDVYALNVDIGQIIECDVSLERKENEILAKKEFENGSTLYIEKIENSKFENYILARLVNIPEKVSDPDYKKKEFMFEDLGLAICDQNDNNIKYESISLSNDQDVMLNDGSIVKRSDLKDTDIIRTQRQQLLKLKFDEDKIPEKLKILPFNRKAYNDRNDGEYNFYMNEDWYQVKAGDVNITEDSKIGGNVTITKIEETDDKIIFNYDVNGYVPEYFNFVLRVKNPVTNYMYPNYTNENKIFYYKDYSKGGAGAPLLLYDRYESLDELEFALFFNSEFEVLSEPLEFEWDTNESEKVAEIKNIKINSYVVDMNRSMDGSTSIRFYFGEGAGFITEVNDKYLKFFSKAACKEMTISNPKQYNYGNDRTKEKINFSDIKVGDYIDLSKFVYIEEGQEYYSIVKSLKGEDLKKELVKQMSLFVRPPYNTEKPYRNVKNIEIIDNNKAILTVEISDMYEQIFGNDEKFEIKIIVDENTMIYRTEGEYKYKGEKFSINDLKTVEYYLDRASVQIDENTINDEMPIATIFEIGWLDFQY